MRHQIAREGFDPGAIDAPLFVFDRARDAYVPLGPETYRAIVSGAMRL